MTPGRVCKALVWSAMCAAGAYEIQLHPFDLVAIGGWLGVSAAFAIGMAWLAIGRAEDRI